MEYILLHKQTEAACVDIDEGGLIRSTVSVISPEHMPAPEGQPLKQWWYGRCIPNARQGISGFLSDNGFPTMHCLLPGSLGLNLSDQYWIRPVDSDVSWDEVNFFDNPFQEAFGTGLMSGAPASDPMTPDIATDGVLGKRWTVDAGRRRLIKSGTEPFRQEPVNEAVATAIMEAQGIPCAHYDLMWDDELPYSVCDCFVTPDTELITAAMVIQNKDREERSNRGAYEKSCTSLGIDIGLAMAQQDFIDYMMMNNDRHLGNYGLIRDADSLDWIGPAPIFDTGTSLMCKRGNKAIRSSVNAGTSDLWMERLYGSDLDWLDMDALHRSIDVASDIIRSTAERSMDEDFDDERADALIGVLRSRAEGLEDLFA